MSIKFQFTNQIVLDLANNHQGDIGHAKEIMESLAAELSESKFSVAIKFQFRDLPEFVHPDARSGSSNKHVRRFLETQLSWDSFGDLKLYAEGLGFGTICTPFDEASVDKVREMNFGAIKIASCSAKDWPLLEKIAGSNLPVVASTGGLNLGEVDDLVSFLQHRGCSFALMHCVSIYPTDHQDCNIRNISGFRKRYPSVPVGWSTHEEPSDTMIGPLAMGVGATIFERHVGSASNGYSLNSYSSDPKQVGLWVKALERASEILGEEGRHEPSNEEIGSIDDLRRGIYAKRRLPKGAHVSREDVFFAFPCSEGQLPSGEWTDGMKAVAEVQAAAALTRQSLSPVNAKPISVLKDSVHEVKALLAYAGVTLQPQFETEFSHHYGVENFRNFGATIVTVINRSYAKKILVMLPGQQHPNHFHKLKEETFLVLHGSLNVQLDGQMKTLQPGETLLVPPGVFHSFSSGTGCVFEEISTTAIQGDSVYQDEQINQLKYEDRKTRVDNWGRFQMQLLR